MFSSRSMPYLVGKPPGLLAGLISPSGCSGAWCEEGLEFPKKGEPLSLRPVFVEGNQLEFRVTSEAGSL
jgi:hypothetical protein